MIVQNIDKIVTRRDYDRAGLIAVTSMFYTIQGEGPFAGRPCVFVRLAGCNYGDKKTHCQFCFPPEHKLQTVNRGKLRFKDVRVGDLLPTLSRNGAVVSTTVTNVLSRTVPITDLVQLKIDVDGKVTTLVCTCDHPIKTSNRGYVQAAKLTERDRIVHSGAGETRSFVVAHHMSGEQNPMKRSEVAEAMKATTAERRVQGAYANIKRTPEQRARYSASKMGNKNPMKRHSVRLKNALAHEYSPSSLEFKYAELFSKLGVKASHNSGTDKKAFGNDEVGYRIPDFVLPGKKVIEVYHTSHTYKVRGASTKRTKRNYETPTRKFYESLGYDVLFLTQLDLPGHGGGKGYRVGTADLSKLKDKVVAFKRNGAKLISMQVGKGRGVNLHDRGDGYVDVVNFSCAPYNTFLVNDIQTHNCDTSFQLDRARWMSPADIVQEIKNLAPENDLVVITGGEPLLQLELWNLLDLLNGDYHTQIESNGTQAAFFRERERLWDDVTLVVSPKANEVTKKYAPVPQAVLENTHALKYLLSADPDSVYHTVPPVTPGPVVYVSPIAVYKKAYAGEVSSIWDTELIDAEATKRNYAYAAEYAMRHGYYLSLQTHLFTAIP